MESFRPRIKYTPHLNVVVPDHLVVLVYRRLEQLVDVLPLNADSEQVAVLEKLAQALANLASGGERTQMRKLF